MHNERQPLNPNTHKKTVPRAQLLIWSTPRVARLPMHPARRRHGWASLKRPLRWTACSSSCRQIATVQLSRRRHKKRALLRIEIAAQMVEMLTAVSGSATLRPRWVIAASRVERRNAVDRRKCVSVSLGNVSILDAQLRKRENLSNFQVVSTCEGKVSPPLPGKNVAAGVAVGLLVRYAMPLNERLSSDHPIPDGIIPSNAQGIVE
jgi:hypothetical protein